MTLRLRALLSSVVIAVSSIALGCEATTVAEEKGSSSNAIARGDGDPLEGYAGQNGYLNITEGGVLAQTSHAENALRAEDSVSAIFLTPEGDAPGPIGEEVGTLTLTETQDWSAIGRGKEVRRDSRMFIRRRNGEIVDGVYVPGVYSTGAFTLVPKRLRNRSASRSLRRTRISRLRSAALLRRRPTSVDLPPLAGTTSIRAEARWWSLDTAATVATWSAPLTIRV